MKRRRLFSSNQGVGRSIGQAVAAGVMALALTVGGVGTTALLVTQPTGLAVEPAAVRTEQQTVQPVQSEQTEQAVQHAVQAQTQPEPAPAPQPVQPEPAPAEKAEVPAAESPAAPAEPAPVQPEPAPVQQPEVSAEQPTAVPMGSVEEENSLPLLLTETPALAAEDPMAPPAPAQENDSAAQRAAEQAEENPVMLTPEQVGRHWTRACWMRRRPPVLRMRTASSAGCGSCCSANPSIPAGAPWTIRPIIMTPTPTSP